MVGHLVKRAHSIRNLYQTSIILCMFTNLSMCQEAWIGWPLQQRGLWRMITTYSSMSHGLNFKAPHCTWKSMQYLTLKMPFQILMIAIWPVILTGTWTSSKMMKPTTIPDNNLSIVNLCHEFDSHMTICTNSQILHNPDCGPWCCI